MQRNKAVAMVLADSDGLLLESSVEGPAAHSLAAMAAAVADGDETAAPARELDVPLTVDEVHVKGVRLLMGVVGKQDASDSAICDAAAGVQRILTSS